MQPEEIVRKIAYGEMTEEQIDDWKRAKVLEIRSDAAKERLKLKYLSLDFDFEHIDEYERYLAMSSDEQKAFVADMTTEEFEVWNDLETARALYKAHVDRDPGSITQAKIDAYPERYRWRPLTEQEAAEGGDYF